MLTINGPCEVIKERILPCNELAGDSKEIQVMLTYQESGKTSFFEQPTGNDGHDNKTSPCSPLHFLELAVQEW